MYLQMVLNDENFIISACNTSIVNISHWATYTCIDCAEMQTRIIHLSVCLLALFSNSLCIQQESAVRQMEGLREEVRNLTQRLQKLNSTLQKGRM